MYQVLNGPTYSMKDRPPFWNNEKVLMVSDMEMERAPIADFPLIEDFEVRLELDTSAREFGYHLYFFSASRGYLASFPWENHIENWLIHDLFTIPMGDFERPFHGTEQTWDIVIAVKDDFIYILQGIDDESAGFYEWFKVHQTQYLAEWEKAVKACKDAFLNKA